MRNPEIILNNLNQQATKQNYKFERLYRNLYNPDFYLQAYDNIYANTGNMTEGTDGKTIDGMSLARIESIIEKIKNESYLPKPVKRVYIPKKDGKLRPLGIPSIDDKLVQEVLKMILESIYENKFSDKSHGFRPNRSCHTALNQVQKSFGRVKWFIEGDIKSFFDNIDHHILISILKRTINDEKIIRLIWKFLRAGYLEDWKYNNSYSGTPQGGIISPLLANIYLNELDEYMEKFTLMYNQGKIRKINQKYQNLNSNKSHYKRRLEKNYSTLNIGERENLKVKMKDIEKQMKTMYSREPMDSNFKRLQYVRYADDFLIGVIGSKEDAQDIKKEIQLFLKNELNLELSMEKTLITHSNDFAKFLGYNITTEENVKDVRYSDGRFVRVHGYIRLELPKEVWVNKLIELGIIDTKSMKGDNEWSASIRTNIINNDDLEIIETYNAELRGLYNYYKLANNASVLNKFHYIMERSLIKTLSCKYRESSRRKILQKYSHNGRICVKYDNKQGEQVIRYFNEKSYKKVKFSYNNIVEDSLPKPIRHSRTSLIERLQAKECEYCKAINVPLEIHHVKKLKDLEGKKMWEKVMISRRRKTIALCISCHHKLHAGKLD